MSADRGNHECSCSTYDSAASKSLREGFSHVLCGLVDARRGIASFDFLFERRSFTEGERDIACRAGPADVIPCLDGNRGEARSNEIFANLPHIRIAMPRSGQEIWWVFGKQ